jgi:hypothetical protein
MLWFSSVHSLQPQAVAESRHNAHLNSERQALLKQRDHWHAALDVSLAKWNRNRYQIQQFMLSFKLPLVWLFSSWSQQRSSHLLSTLASIVPQHPVIAHAMPASPPIEGQYASRSASACLVPANRIAKGECGCFALLREDDYDGNIRIVQLHSRHGSGTGGAP